jgi:hypothetical protein
MTEPQIDTIKIGRLDLKPGQILVAHLPEEATATQFERAKTTLERLVPPGVRVLVCSDKVQFTVIDPPKEPA